MPGDRGFGFGRASLSRILNSYFAIPKKVTILQARNATRYAQQLAALAICRRPRSFRPKKLAAAVVVAGLLGDFILASGAIRLLLDEFGETNILLFICPQGERLAARLFPRTPRLVIPFAIGRFLRDVVPDLLRYRKGFGQFTFDRLICLRHQRYNFHEVMLSWIRSRQSYGFENDPFYRKGTIAGPFRFDVSLSDRHLDLECVVSSGLCLELERNRLLMESVLQRKVSGEDIIPQWEGPPKTPVGEYLLVAPFGSSPIRSYPDEKLLQALRAISSEHSIPIRLCGDGNQRISLEKLARRAQDLGIPGVTIANTSSFDQFLDSVRDATAIISVETSTAHLAVAYDKPAVLLLGGGVYGMCAPWRRSPRQIWLHRKLECYHCHWHCIKAEPVCITELPVTEFASAVASVLKPSR